MKVLVDTQSMFWFANDPSRLSAPASEAMNSSDHELLFSLASLWEMSIKIGIGKMSLPVSLEVFAANQLAAAGVEIVNLTTSDVIRAGRLPQHHRDPFDRVLAAQAILRSLPIVSSDSIFDQYGVTRIW